MLEVWETRSSGEKSLTGFEQKKYSVYFIQEMHCTESNKKDWRAISGYQTFFSRCTSKKPGVAILFSNREF